MNNDDMTFLHEHLDEQIEHPMDHLMPDDQRLVHDLRQTYQAYKQENDQSLRHVWMRLEHQRQEQRQQGTTRISHISLLQRKKTMKDISFSDSSSQGSIQRTLSLLAAVLVVIVLAGSAVLVFHAAGQSNRTHKGSNNQSSNGSQPIPVVNSSGIYITYTSQAHLSVVSKLDAQTHKALWTFQRQDLTETGSPAVYGDTVFLNAANDLLNQSHLIALNATTGTIRWDVPFKTVMSPSNPNGGSSPSDLGVLTMPVTSNSQVFVTNRAGTVFAFDVKTGKQNWTYETGASALVSTYYTDPTTGKQMLAGSTIYNGSTPVVSNGVLYGALDKTIYAISLQTGKPVWIHKLSSQSQVLGDAQIVDGIVYASSFAASEHTGGQVYQSYVYAFNGQNGKQNWQASIQGWVTGSLAIDNEHIYFIGRQPLSTPVDSMLYAFTIQGKKAWTHDFSGIDILDPTLGNGYISVSGGTYNQGNVTSYTLSVLKANNGQPAWQKDVVTDPVSIENGVLYTTSGLKIIAYDLTSQKEVWQGQYGVDIVDKMGNHNGRLLSVLIVP